MVGQELPFTAQESVMPRHTVYDLNHFKTDTTPNAFSPCKSVRFNTAGTYKVYFAGRPTTAISQTYAAGEIEESQIVKITTSADGVVAAGAVFLYY